jgi:hypothetical protein
MEHLVCTGFLIHQTEFQQNFRLIHHKLCYKYHHSALMSEKLCPETSPWGWKALIITCILSFIFMVVFYLAMNNEADYMPMNQKKAAAQAEMSQSSMTTETGNTETHQHHE